MRLSFFTFAGFIAPLLLPSIPQQPQPINSFTAK